MKTVINNPGGGDSNGSSFGIIVIIILILVGGFLVYRYGWPSRHAGPASSSTNVNVTIPTP